MWRLTLALALAGILFAADAHAGAWTLKRGETQSFLVSSFTYGDHSYDADGNLVEVPEYRKFELTTTIEHGIRPWLTAIAKGELKAETQEVAIGSDAEPDQRTFGSVAAGARVRIAEGQTVLADRVERCRTVRLPAEPGPNPEFDDGPRGEEERRRSLLARADAALFGGGDTRVVRRCSDSRQELNWVLSGQLVALSGGFDSIGAAAPNDGAGIEVRLLAGVGQELLGRDTFAELQVGYRERLAKEDADEVLLDLTFGAKLAPRWQALVQTFSTFELGEETQSHKVSGSLVYQATRRLRVEAGATTTVYGQNTLREVGGRFGLWYTF